MAKPRKTIKVGRTTYKLHAIVKSYDRASTRKTLINRGYDVKTRLVQRAGIGDTSFDSYAIYKTAKKVRGACPRGYFWSPKYKTCLSDRILTDAYRNRRKHIRQGIKPKKT